MPLLDISNNIERRSEDWPVDPEGNSLILYDSDESVKRMNFLAKNHPFGKPSRSLVELFVLVNMSCIMYVAVLTFSKGLN